MGTNSNLKVFSNDPVKFKEYVDKVVRIKAIGNKVFEGTVYTIDPVCESIVLVRKRDGETSVEFVFGHAIQEIEYIGESLFIPKLFEERLEPGIDLSHKREKLKKWLNKNMIPIEECEDKLVFGDVVTIVPPYDIENCLCTNDIVLGNIQRLIRSMPIETVN
uniref:Putative gem nuclear organelle associated protein 6 n=1 Tax=Triatoma dimidiata TaxID=72491 RepID=A0A0V0GF60_TRIDM